MKKGIFYDWLKQLDAYIGLKSGGKILSLIYNCAAHGKTESMPTLQKVRVFYLLPNMTRHLQLLDVDIIA